MDVETAMKPVLLNFICIKAFFIIISHTLVAFLAALVFFWKKQSRTKILHDDLYVFYAQCKADMLVHQKLAAMKLTRAEFFGALEKFLI